MTSSRSSGSSSAYNTILFGSIDWVITLGWHKFNVKTGLKPNQIFYPHSFQVGVQQKGGCKGPDAENVVPVFAIAYLHIKALHLVKHQRAIFLLSFPDVGPFQVYKIYPGAFIK